MAVAVDMTYTVSGMDTYHKACAHMGFAGGEHPGAGIVFHWVEPVQGGFVVHEVWESEEQFTSELQPLSIALGTEEPELTVRSVESYRRPV
jgi:hypothetical protein